MLSISDWISFLASEKNSNTGNIISLTAVIIAAVALIMSVANNNWGGAVGSALICVTLMTVYYKTTSQYERHAKEAGRLLNDIMRGEERDLSKIEERWKEISKKGKRKKQGMHKKTRYYLSKLAGWASAFLSIPYPSALLPRNMFPPPLSQTDYNNGLLYQLFDAFRQNHRNKHSPSLLSQHVVLA